jgi:VWFA-related protein
MTSAAARIGGALLCGGLTVAAQSPTFRSGTTLIEFTVVAVDGKGHPVTDLRQDEVSIRENDQPRAVAFFQFEGATDNAQRPEPLAPGIFTNRSEYTPGPPRNLTAIVLDAMNTSPNGQRLASAQILRYLRTVPPGSRIGLYRLGEQMAVLHDFTEDLESLRARIARNEVEDTRQRTDRGGDFAGLMISTSEEKRQAMAEMAAVEARVLGFFNDGLKDRRLASTLAGLEALGTHLAGIPGRKNLVWISEGLPMIRWADGFIKIDNEIMRRTARRLASQGIAIYPVDARGIAAWDTGIGSLASGSSKGQRPPSAGEYLADSRGEQNRWAAMDLWAGVTGGQVIRLTNDPTRGVGEAAADLRAAYSLGFYAAREPDNQWHALTVKVTRPGVRLRHAQGYIAATTGTDATPQWTAARWGEVAYNPLGSTAVRLDARCELGEGTLRFALQIAGHDLSFRRRDNEWITELDVAIAEKTSIGPSRIRQEEAVIRMADDPASDPASTVVRFVTQWVLDPRTTRVRLIVRDRVTDRYGTVDIPVDRLPLQ